MARGWESKSVEEQQSQFKQHSAESKSRPSPEAARKAVEMQALHLQRAQVEERLRSSENARYKELLQRELDHLDHKLRELRAG